MEGGRTASETSGISLYICVIFSFSPFPLFSCILMIPEQTPQPQYITGGEYEMAPPPSLPSCDHYCNPAALCQKDMLLAVGSGKTRSTSCCRVDVLKSEMRSNLGLYRNFNSDAPQKSANLCKLLSQSSLLVLGLLEISLASLEKVGTIVGILG